MFEQLPVALVQFEPQPMGNKENNLAFHLEQIQHLGQQGYKLIVFPELSLTGFFVHQAGERKRYWEEDAESIPGHMTNAIAKLTELYGCYVVAGIAEREREYDVYNTVVLIGPSGVIGKTRKLHLPMAEKMYYKPGGIGEVYGTPIGNIGMCICYEAFFPEVSRILALRGADIIIAPSSIWKGGKSGGIGSGESKRRLFETAPIIRAMENQVHFLLCNAGGKQFLGEAFGTWERFGLSKIVNAEGELVAASETNQLEVVKGVLSRESLQSNRAVYTFFSDRFPQRYHEISEV